MSDREFGSSRPREAAMKSVVVTGATSGIGMATALELSARGYQVIGTARTTEKAEKLAATAAERHMHLHTVLLDVTDRDSCRTAMAEITDMTEGGPWALVNNAGIAVSGAFEDVCETDAWAVLETNLLGTARMTRLALPTMRRRGEGRIVQISSVAGLVAMPLNGWYCAGKHALEALTDALRRETAGSGIHVSLIEPGFINTPMLTDGLRHFPAHTRYETAYATMRRIVASRGPLGPEVVARTVVKALTVPVPRRRYGIGYEAALGRLARLAPSAAVDLTLRTVLQLNRS
ncbi:SDR family oxidoreductase [Streptomyces sp. NPDC006610]|uniref:SDR family oxidoreductase n=1 Tax=Streptomyces sp. NPDC006610 TaxID=3154584 RepID=UPI0033B8C249